MLSREAIKSFGDTIPRAVVSLVALIIAGGVQLRHWTVEPVTGGLLLLAAVPWLGWLFKSVEIAGWKFEMREVRKELRSVRGGIESNRQQVEVAQTKNRGPALEPQMGVGNPIDPLGQLAAEYDRYRDENRGRPSSERTAAMTRIVARMQEVARRSLASQADSDLESPSLGKRLAAFSVLYEHPDQQAVGPLLESISDTKIRDQPFVQYWGILALGRLLEAANWQATPQTKRAINDLIASLPPDTDRGYELRRIRKSIES